MSKEPTVFLVISDGADREFLKDVVSSFGLHVEAFPSPEAYLGSLDHTRPGCLVLDVDLPGMSGLELQSELSARGGFLPVIFLTKTSDMEMAVRAMKARAFDFLLWSSNALVLIDRIEQAIRLDAEARDDRTKQHEAAALLACLTPREREVFELVVSGTGNKQIAARLGLSEKTIEFHRAKLKKKLGVESTADLVRLSVLGGPHGGTST